MLAQRHPVSFLMPLSKIPSVPNRTNSRLINEFRHYMHSKNCSERHQNKLVRTLDGFIFNNIGEYPVGWLEHYVIYSVKSKGKRNILDPLTRGATRKSPISI